MPSQPRAANAAVNCSSQLQSQASTVGVKAPAARCSVRNYRASSRNSAAVDAATAGRVLSGESPSVSGGFVGRRGFVDRDGVGPRALGR